MQKKTLFKRLTKIANKAFYHYAGRKHRPVFIDIEKTCPALLEIEQNYEIIRRELNAVLEKKEYIPRYHDVDKRQARISGSGEQDKEWKVFFLYAVGEKPMANRAQCPQTSAILDKIPHLFQAHFSILDPGKCIPAHSGPYKGYLRYHLGLKVPKSKPPMIRVKDQYHTWAEGKSVLFDDSWEHEVYNDSDDIRVVLIVDILRPMPFALHALNWLLSYVVIRKVYAKKLMQDLLN
jgi:aspartyl/asparaginyl beta-hydroxylase (cupin superfamily)